MQFAVLPFSLPSPKKAAAVRTDEKITVSATVLTKHLNVTESPAWSSTSSTSCWQSRILCLQQHNCSVPMALWPFSLRQLSWQALLFYSHYLCILLKSFLCSPWPPFYCHFCPKCPVYTYPLAYSCPWKRPWQLETSHQLSLAGASFWSGIWIHN